MTDEIGKLLKTLYSTRAVLYDTAKELEKAEQKTVLTQSLYMCRGQLLEAATHCEKVIKNRKKEL